MFDYVLGIDVALPLPALRAALAILGTSVATYFDLFNNRNIPNILLYAFLGIAVLLDIFTLPFPSLAYAGAIAILVSVFGFMLYRMGQLGGADVFIIAAIALLLPIQPADFLFTEKPAFNFPFILSVLFVSGMAFMLAMLATNILPAVSALRKGKVKLSTEKYIYLGVIAACYAAFLYFGFTIGMMPLPYFALFTLLIFSAAFFMLFREFVTEKMIELVPLSKIDEEDVLAIDRMSPALVAKYKLQKVLTLSELKRMKKFPIRKYPVFKRMPVFIPYLLFGLLVTIFFGDLLLIAMRLY